MFFRSVSLSYSHFKYITLQPLRLLKLLYCLAQPMWLTVTTDLEITITYRLQVKCCFVLSFLKTAMGSLNTSERGN